MAYVHQSSALTTLGFQAWDGEDYSNVYDLKIVPFAFLSQYLFAEKLLIVDISTLHEIASKLEGPKGNCIMINNIGRCGSTLLCQVSNNISLLH